ncbi:MAG: hypothetical protein IT378_03475 [Sandaracinaceae bacterium]|nr:hypothetical protein [Sandaracinaceae bacterium]
MDPLREDDVRQMRETPPAEEARQALEMMQTGIRLKRAALRARHPSASDEQIEAKLQAWLDTDD